MDEFWYMPRKQDITWCNSPGYLTYRIGWTVVATVGGKDQPAIARVENLLNLQWIVNALDRTRFYKVWVYAEDADIAIALLHADAKRAPFAIQILRKSSSSEHVDYTPGK